MSIDLKKDLVFCTRLTCSFLNNFAERVFILKLSCKGGGKGASSPSYVTHALASVGVAPETPV